MPSLEFQPISGDRCDDSTWIRLRLPRDGEEMAHAAPGHVLDQLYPNSVPARVFVTHTRPEPLLGTLQSLNMGCDRTAALGFVNQGGTLG
ncbi:hypothetical protein IQ238_06215 [Pleurocapsales cyanobacterium LEGE 06147]|nr:hypothetical protein [Pleurocapsales cyanobacterium LEGE 06147]